MLKRLECMKETLMCAIESQLCDLSEVDTEELGEAIDMVKDLEEAIYYCTVTEAMRSAPEHSEDRMYYDTRRKPWPKRMDKWEKEYDYEEEEEDWGSMKDNWDTPKHTDKDGKSYNSRRMYMEAKEMKKDKAVQLRELEKYMNELSQDVTEMIADSSPEEKQYMEKKITALATKIGQMK